MQLKKRLLVLALAVLLVLPCALLSPALPVAAQTTSDLYGTGSADEINIVKLLDMALNKGGMSMSPATIRAFLEYWWSSVQSDLNTCISNADTAITTTQAFADYVISALENADHYNKLGSIMQQYVRFVLTLDAKSVSDFKQLLTQQGTFRRFLLSYVTDQDGNIANTVDNKIKKYNIGKTLVNMTRQAAEAYIEEYEGYYLVPTLTYKDVPVSKYSSKEVYDNVIASLKTISDDGIFLYSGTSYNDFACVDGLNLVGLFNPDARNFPIRLYNNNWEQKNAFYLTLSSEPFDLSNWSDLCNRSENRTYLYTTFIFSDSSVWRGSSVLFTKDGRAVKVWKSLDNFKAFSVGQSNIYYTNAYSNYDSSVDNSIEFSGSYYNSSSSTYSHDVIQNSIDNSSEVNESTVNNIVNNYITNNNYGGSSGSGSGSSGSGGWWNVGDGIEAFIQGVAELLDFALKLLGDLVGLLGRFLTDVLEVFKSLGVVGSGFGEFLKEVFGFLPDECISLIMSSIGAMCIVGVVKAFKK